MTTELYWLTLTVLMTAIFWVPCFLDRVASRGLLQTVSETRAETVETHSLWAQRAMRAHLNAVENLILFAPAVLIAHALNVSTPATRGAAVVYFFARLAHFLGYTAGIPFARTLSFTVGWGALVVILASILRWI